MTETKQIELANQIATRVADILSDRPLIVDRRKLAQLLVISVPTIDRLRKNGVIPEIRVGRSVRFDTADVVAKLKSSRESSRMAEVTEEKE